MLFLVETVFTTYSLRHSRIRVHAPLRATRVSARRMCLERRAAIGSPGSGFSQQPSIFNGQCAAAPVASAIETLQSCSASAAGAVLLHARASTQSLSLRLTHPLGRRHTQTALRCTANSLPPAPSRLVAQARLHRAVPNRRWSGQPPAARLIKRRVGPRHSTKLGVASSPGHRTTHCPHLRFMASYAHR